MKKLQFLSILSLTSLILMSSPAHSQDKTAEELVAGMKKADMTYQQLMQMMGRSLTTINEGILLQNKQMVKEGTNFIFNHPAPNHKPWKIVHKEDQQDFKDTLVSFDQQLDENANEILYASDREDWMAANQASADLLNTCVSCHIMWRHKIK